jgi:hypothetical protein
VCLWRAVVPRNDAGHLAPPRDPTTQGDGLPIATPDTAAPEPDGGAGGALDPGAAEVDGAALELGDAVDRAALELGLTGFEECCALDDAERVGRLRVDGALCVELLLCDAELPAVTGTATWVRDRLECAPLLGAPVLVTGAVVPPPVGAAPCGDGFRIRIAPVTITARNATAATAMPTPRCRRGSGAGSAVGGAR